MNNRTQCRQGAAAATQSDAKTNRPGLAWRLALIVAAVALLAGDSVSAAGSKRYCACPRGLRWVDSAATHFHAGASIFPGVKGGQTRGNSE